MDVALAALAVLTKVASASSIGCAGMAAGNLLRSAPVPSNHDLYKHVVLMGSTGSGKTNAMKWRAKELYDAGWSVWWLAIQRRSADELLSSIPDSALEGVTWICPDEPEPLGLNLLSCPRNTAAEWSLVAEQVVAIMQQQDSAWGAHIGESLGNAVYAVLEWGAGAGQTVTLWDAVRVLCEDGFRSQVLCGVTQPAVLTFFTTVFPTVRNSAIRAVARILRLLRNDHLLKVLSSPDSVDVGELMNRRGLNFVVADMHGLGSRLASALYLSVVVSKMEGLAYSRDAWATPCAIFLDEFHLYATESLGNLLEQGRRHNMSLWLACQGTWQSPVAETSAWQTGTWHIFRPQVTKDAPKLARALEVEEGELSALPDCVSISREMIGGKAQTARRIAWPIYPNGTSAQLAENKRFLLERRASLPRAPLPEIRLPRVPTEDAPRVAVAPEMSPSDSEGPRLPVREVGRRNRTGRIRL